MSVFTRALWVAAAVTLFACGGTTSTPDASTPVSACGGEGAGCGNGQLCRGNACTGCVDETDDAACKRAWGARTFCISGACVVASCRVDADCSRGLKCTSDNACAAITCSAPAPMNGTANGKATATVGAGGTANYGCNAGFALMGAAPVCGNDGMLAGAAPTCAAVTCRVTSPTNGTLNGGTAMVTLAYNATATWACNAGFTLVGTAPRCDGTGQLSGPAPTCAAITCNASAPMNGTLNGGTTAVTLAFNATATWACNAGYVLAGTAPTCTGQNMLSGAAPTCALTACNDAVDGDGDGFVGFPTDPGCSGISDNDESDDCPSGPNCPACANGLDDDGDTKVDFPDDVACVSASGTSELAACTSADAVATFTTNLTAVPFAGTADDVDLSCGGNGRDVVYRFFVAAPLASLSADTAGSASPAAVAFRAPTCSATDLVCATGNLGANARATLTTVAVGEYFIVVDDLATPSATTFNLNVVGIYPAAARCNPASTILRCADGFACAGAAGAETCVVAACNDTVDADGDGHPGYPTDPGCTSVSDNDESDVCPNGPGCPLCSDGVDNDGDGQLDYPADTSCTSAAGTSEN